jgi:2-dehydro-3-deoxygluconokinase
MVDVVTFGESMIRLCPPNFQRLEQANTFDVNIGGAELTVAAGVSRLGIKSAWVSRLPSNPLGRMIENKARSFGVDTSHILWTKDGRVGLYFVEYGASPRPSSVFYDRAHSSISYIQPGEINWENILLGTRLFHISGITPALSDTASQVTMEALSKAKKLGTIVSYDLNYRAKLWTEEKAKSVQTPLMEFVDILITTEEDVKRVFGVQDSDYRRVAEKLSQMFGINIVTITLRNTPSVWKNNWSALAYSNGKNYEDVTYDIEVVDRVGGGDNYAAGFIYGYLTKDIEYGVRFGNAFSALKHTSWGDFNFTTLEEVQALMNGLSLRITR